MLLRACVRNDDDDDDDDDKELRADDEMISEGRRGDGGHYCPAISVLILEEREFLGIPH